MSTHITQRIAPSSILGLCLAVAACTAMSVTGCGTSTHSGSEMLTYPASLEQERTIDVQVFRRGTKLIATNTSAQSFGPGRIWVNQEFSYPVDGFGVGQTIELELTRFKNDLGVPFRAGGFFATLSPKPVVLVQVQEDASPGLVGLVVVDDEPR